MASFTFNSLQQKHLLLSATLCKYPPTLNLFGNHYSSTSLTFSPTNFKPELPPISVVKENVRPIVSKLSTTEVEPSTGTVNSKTLATSDNGFPSLSCEGENLGKKYASSVAEDKDVNRRNLGFRNRREIINGKFNLRSKDKIVASKSLESVDRIVVNKKTDISTKQVIEEKKGKESKKNKVDSTEVKFRVQLDMCSKRGDVIDAIQFYDKAVKEGIKMGQYHYTVLLYLCSSAAVGIVRPAKSGKSSRSLDMLDTSSEVSRENNHMGSTDSGELASKELDGKDMHESDSDSETLIDTCRSSNRFDDIDDTFNEKENLTSFSNGFVKRNSCLLDGLVYPQKYDLGVKDGNNNQEDDRIWADENAKKYALQRGFEIYEKMCLDNIPMNEAALTSVARMAMSMGNGDMAFDMVKQMKVLGINPRLRSYGPSLSAFCNSGNVEKAFSVEQHMVENGVYPEEPELAALLRVSIAAGKGDKVYYLLHKLRTTVRKVSPSTAEVIVNWFNSKAASSVGKTKWDQSLIKEAIENGGGGWHGQGWLRRGKWSVLRTTIGADGMCKCCGDKLATIDLDPKETEEFAESVASIAIKREKNSNFQKFQKWLDYYGPFEAVVDAANVGLFGQKRFVPSKVNAVVNGIRQKLPSKKWPLIVLHNKRVTGQKMDEPLNKALIDKWRNADALYTTPTGSNDDWYWLYAAIKFKCLIVTNDEMRDHVFQLLGNDFFPKWKERHQVHFTFSNAGPVFHMPPLYSVVIQESEKGHWHIPILSEHDYEAKRPWLCVMRAKSRAKIQDFETKNEGSVMMQTKTKSQANPKTTSYKPQEIYMNFKDILSGSTLSNRHSILKEIETAEKIGSCIIDFQI